MTLESMIQKYPASPEYLVEALRDYQMAKNDHSVTESEIVKIAKYFNVTESKVCSVVSFYSFLSEKPKGRYVIRICRDVPCFVNKSESILKTLETRLGIKPGETTPDGLFTLEYTGCLGQCDHAPAFRINDMTYVDLTPDKVKAILSEYREEKS
ncbi:MAG: NAD(P)H-dependent oxidoreductase subunit E [Candidatus Izemoplasmatales bacterium]|nr:NAD(P)H-dependent oxidoreductase subunit E [Candidatus Izemoplasmatales bacterium]MDD3865163.1 NAD(P)H-dependent oxidoreductase subunit E [Candidatus Izemoplasmatales bacterium]